VGVQPRAVDGAEVTHQATAWDAETIRRRLSHLTHTHTRPLLLRRSTGPTVDITASGSMNTGKRPLPMDSLGPMLLRPSLRRITIPTTPSPSMPSNLNTRITQQATSLQPSHNMLVPMLALRPHRRSGRHRRALPSKRMEVPDLIVVAIRVIAGHHGEDEVDTGMNLGKHK
jgi:hypothetical protein